MKYENKEQFAEELAKSVKADIDNKNKELEKAVDSINPKTAYDPNLSAEEHVARVKMHNMHASKEAAAGNKESAQWHLKQASQHFAAAKGNPPPLPVHNIP